VKVDRPKVVENTIFVGADQGAFLSEYSLPVLNRRIRTRDGVEIDTLRLGEKPQRGVVICHGFGGNKNIAGLVACAEALAGDYTVYTFDFRGHGLSGGSCTFTEREVDDLGAVLDMARVDGNLRLAVLGFSMGGIASMRYAALRGGLDSLVVVSVPARLEEARAPGSRFLRFLCLTAPGRSLLGSRFGVRVARDWDVPYSPADLVEHIAPQPLTIIHGTDDYIFEVEQAEELHRLAGEGTRLKVFEGFGHAEQGCGPELFHYVKEVLARDLA
jgi:pimeloyl-ACP methyl ester carboxylesterase